MAKKVLIWMVVAFAVYSLLSDPGQTADAVRSAGQGLRSAANALIRFFDALST